MIISHKHKHIFVTTPKCGSHTGFKLMQDYFEAPDTGFNHSRAIPKEYKHYKSFTFVRNPYERFCALYHACIVNDRKPWIPKKVKSIYDYAFYLADKKNWGSRPDLTIPQYKWHEKSKLDLHIKIESAQNLFDLLYPDLNIKMPHELKRTHSVWSDERTPELTQSVNEWAGKDFELYGYTRDESSYR